MQQVIIMVIRIYVMVKLLFYFIVNQEIYKALKLVYKGTELFYRHNKYDEAIASLREALGIFKAKNYKKDIRNVTFTLGNIYFHLDNCFKAEEYFNELLEDSADAKKKSPILFNLANIYTYLGNYSKAEEYYQKSIEIHVKAKNFTVEGATLSSLSSLYYLSGNYAKSLDYKKRALEKLKKSNVYSAVEKYKQEEAGLIKLEEGKFDEALKIFEKSNYSLGLAMYYLKLERYNEAKEILERFMTDVPCPRIKNELDTVRCIGLGFAYEGLQDYAQAKKYFEDAIKIIDQQLSNLTKEEKQLFISAKIIPGFFRSEPFNALSRIKGKLN